LQVEGFLSGAKSHWTAGAPYPTQKFDAQKKLQMVTPGGPPGPNVDADDSTFPFVRPCLESTRVL
jgi:hypothetical protein